MKLGVQEVRTALRRTQTGLAGLVARVRAFVGLAYVSSLRALNLFLFPFLSAEAYEVFSKSTVDARMRGVCASPDVRGATPSKNGTSAPVDDSVKNLRHRVWPQALEGRAARLCDQRDTLGAECSSRSPARCSSRSSCGLVAL